MRDADETGQADRVCEHSIIMSLNINIRIKEVSLFLVQELTRSVPDQVLFVTF